MYLASQETADNDTIRKVERRIMEENRAKRPGTPGKLRKCNFDAETHAPRYSLLILVLHVHSTYPILVIPSQLSLTATAHRELHAFAQHICK